MEKTQVVIVGGGLAGLYAARKLQDLGINYQLYESKALFGGRVAGVPCEASHTKFHDLGPSWVFPQHFRTIALADELNIELFDQYAHGDVLYQFENIKLPRRISNRPNDKLKRFDGGAYSLVRSLVRGVNMQSLNAGHTVTNLKKVGMLWQVEVKHQDKIHKIACLHVILAMPPRIIARDFSNCSWMTSTLQTQLNRSQTWMASQAKFVVTYKTPFWREQDLSGQAFSQVGPLVEVYDACASDSDGFALFGFIGMAATQRIPESQKVLKQSCIRQLANIFGHDAYRFEKCYIKDWAKDKHVCTGQDQSEGSRHPTFDISLFEDELLQNNMHLVASEFAKSEAGYMEGALAAVNDAIEALEQELI